MKRVVIITLGLAVMAVASASVFLYLRSPRRPTAHAQSWPARPPAPPAQILALNARVLSQTPLYEGDPVHFRVRVDSPRARQIFYKSMRQREAGGTAPPPLDFQVPEIPAEKWALAVTVRLARVGPDAAERIVYSGEKLKQFRVRAVSGGLPVATKQSSYSAPMEEWILPSAVTAGLVPGTYSLQVIWSGTDLVDKSLLDPQGQLRAEPVTFQVTRAGSAEAQATHLGRLAELSLVSGDYQAAREQGQASLRLDPGITLPERTRTYLLVAQASLAVGDKPGARVTYEELLRRFPPDSDLAIEVQKKLERLK